MKKETYAEKLAALLGLSEVKQQVEEKKKQRNGNLEGIAEEDIQEFRAMQGITYFLQAPELFQHKVCKHCGEHYLVSRMYVAYCSYTCIRKSLNEQGLEWRKGNDIEALVRDVYEGNEPIWISNLARLNHALQEVTNSVESR